MGSFPLFEVRLGEQRFFNRSLSHRGQPNLIVGDLDPARGEFVVLSERMVGSASAIRLTLVHRRHVACEDFRPGGCLHLFIVDD